MPAFAFAGCARRALTASRPIAQSLLGRIRRFFRRCRRKRSTPEPGPDRPDMLIGSEVDYFGLANSLIDGYGPGARAEATRLMEDAMREEDALAVADWLTVGHAIALLMNDSAGARH
jgi:hypothetical protein